MSFDVYRKKQLIEKLIDVVRNDGANGKKEDK